VLAAGSERLDDFAVLMIREGDDRGIDVARLGHLLPGGRRSLEPESRLRIAGERLVGLRDDRQLDVGHGRPEELAQAAEGVGVGTSNHARPDDRDS
jgi:hypothetical protein